MLKIRKSLIESHNTNAPPDKNSQMTPETAGQVKQGIPFFQIQG